jgi:hypothetical protein
MTEENQKLIDLMMPVLDDILKIDNRPAVNEVSIILMKDDKGEAVLNLSAWAHCERITAPSLGALPAAVKAFDPVDRERKRRAERVAELENELLRLKGQ